LDRLVKLLEKHLSVLPNAEVKMEHKVVGIEQDEKEARVKVETPEGVKMFSADYIIGADGANSQIRRSLFGDWEFPGETLQYQIIATNVSLSAIKKAPRGSADNTGILRL
jgi:2-polyprenyl-6-methoxyphenol hydroxylase-like FAD-dependent oxidoreductase